MTQPNLDLLPPPPLAPNAVRVIALGGLGEIGRNMTVLATAFSDPQNNGSGRDEPQLMVLSYGKGRVFHTTLGHDVNALSSVDFVVTLQRGTEWAATGQVTQKVPTSFPTAATVSYRADLAAMDAAYRLGLDALTASRR